MPLVSLLFLLTVAFVQVAENFEQFHEDADDVDVQVQGGENVFFFADLQFTVATDHLKIVDDVNAEHCSTAACQDEVEELATVENADQAADRQRHN